MTKIRKTSPRLFWRVRLIEIALEGLRWLAHLGEQRLLAVSLPGLAPAVLLLVLAATAAAAQDPDRPSAVVDVVKRLALDPTTYAPAALAYEAHHLDWKSSQVFFQHGFLEHNGEFTVSGKANDTPVSYGAGNRKVVAASFAVLRTSVIHNVSGAIVEHLLVTRYPKHRKLVRRIGWIERIAFAACLSYRESASHFRQWRSNEQLARQLGYQ